MATKKKVRHRLMNWWPGCGRQKPKTVRPSEAGVSRMKLLAPAAWSEGKEQLQKLAARWVEIHAEMQEKIKEATRRLRRRKGGRRRRLLRGELSLLGTAWRFGHLPINIVASLTPQQADALLQAEQQHPKTWKALKGGSSRWWDFVPIPLMIRISYPLRNIVLLEYTPPAPNNPGQFFMSVGHVLWHVARAYSKIYAQAEASERGQQKYGIWGHSIDDLVFEGITIRENGVVDLSIGS